MEWNPGFSQGCALFPLLSPQGCFPVLMTLQLEQYIQMKKTVMGAVRGRPTCSLVITLLDKDPWKFGNILCKKKVNDVTQKIILHMETWSLMHFRRFVLLTDAVFQVNRKLTFCGLFFVGIINDNLEKIISELPVPWYPGQAAFGTR